MSPPWGGKSQSWMDHGYTEVPTQESDSTEGVGGSRAFALLGTLPRWTQEEPQGHSREPQQPCFPCQGAGGTWRKTALLLASQHCCPTSKGLPPAPHSVCVMGITVQDQDNIKGFIPWQSELLLMVSWAQSTPPWFCGPEAEGTVKGPQRNKVAAAWWVLSS